MTTLQPHAVLIVDDEPGLRLALRTSFIREGWEATVASGVREARTALQLRLFELVVSDLRMADGDGFDVLQAVRGTSPSTAVLFLTALASVPEAVKAVRGGALDYLVKPVSFDVLLDVAQRTLEHRRTILPKDANSAAPAVARSAIAETEVPAGVSMMEMERTHLRETLERVGGNRTHAAELLGISVRTLRNKVRQYDLPPRRYA